ncbi:MAG: T9SS type A sorting domain-containing protein [Ignavibacteriales bacterium]|nr:T9SS type A sorting domain-containing protein [Ignavibacteriales bacterium]
MRKKLLFLILVIFSVNLFSQTAKYPYPIIFLHGLVSSDNTWTQAITALGGSAKVFDVCLDHDGNRATASLTNDISIIGWRDGNSTPSPNRLYVMNFDNTRFQVTGHSSHTLSNQSAIYKQGIALKEMIRAVLTIENASKVILIGHSMGGLEIREYLQRGYDGTTNGRGSNWVDQSSASGHSVARVVTLGTPHLGSNHTGGILFLILSGIDESSEACRDLRFTTPTTPTAPYLFGGNESAYAWNPQPYNKDVNCNGSPVDLITGLNSGTSFNSAIPLPSNIWYTWITSNYLGRNEDGLVDLSCQWLYSGTTITPQSADTLLLNINHIEEPNNVHAIIRGIDEPSDPNYAYELPENQLTKGYITHGTNWNSRDVDAFSYKASQSGKLEITFTNTNSGADSLYVYDGTTILSSKAVQSGTQTFDVNNAAQDKIYHIIIKGTATGTSWQNPYSISCKTVLPDDVNENEIPLSFQLYQNYPNPFNPETIISYQLPTSGIVTLKIFDILGREAAELMNEEKTAGRYEVKFDGSKLPSGIYIYRLTGNNVNISKKMTLTK